MGEVGVSNPLTSTCCHHALTKALLPTGVGAAVVLVHHCCSTLDLRSHHTVLAWPDVM